jgi:carboxylesterase
MGASLALAIAQEHGPRVSGLVLVNPAVKIDDWRVHFVPILRHVMPSAAAIGSDIKKPGVVELCYDRSPVHAAHSQFLGWKNVIRDLPEVTQPVLVLHSVDDHVVPASSSELVLARISSQDATEIVLHDSYHVATLDNDAPRIFEESAAFIERLSA